MRVAVDFKSVSTEAALRGMGRYTQQQVREVLIADPAVEVFLFVHGAIAQANALFDWSSFPQAHVIPVSVDGHDLDYRKMPSFDTVLRYSHRLQELLLRFKIDVFHNTVPFMYPYYSAITVCPVVTTFYDAIPLIFPRDYFGLEEQRLHYYRCMQNVASSDRVIAISQSAASDLGLYTGYAPEKISIAYPVIEGVFGSDSLVHDLSRGHENSLAAALSGPFVLSVCGVHRSKNIGVLMEAFAAAAPELDPSWRLAIVLPSEWAHSEFRRRFGYPANVVTFSDITDPQLNELYNRAEIVVQPSIYEGFGYPVAEAMSCGAAVIASNTSSIPEIAGDAAILVSPSDPPLMAAAITRLARDRELREELRRRARERSVMFRNPETLGRTTVEAYRSASTPHRQAPSESSRPHVAVWSSMPPLDCGVAAYSVDLVDALADTCDVSVYVDGNYQPTPSRSPHIRFRHPLDFGIDGAPAANIFQVGARNYQEYMFPYMRRHGGVMMLHDVSMGLGFYFIAKSSNSMNIFEDEIVSPEGLGVLEEYAAMNATFEWGDRQVLEDFFQKHKLLRWIVDRSDCQLVHTEPLRQRLIEDYPDANAKVVRFGVMDALPGQRHFPGAVTKAALGVTGNGICVGVFGIVDRVKRIDVALRSFEKLCRDYPGSVLIIAGRCYEDKLNRELKELMATLGIADRVLQLDFLPPAAHHALMALVDVVVNLRAPDRMGLSGILMRSMAAAKPVIISDLSEWSIFPGDICLRVGFGPDEEPTLARYLRELAASADLRKLYGVAARRWFLNNATTRAMADDYLAVSQCASAAGH